MKTGYFILGALMLIGLLVYFFAPPLYVLDEYTIRDVGFGVFALSFFLTFLKIVADFSQKKDK
jgi:hypothetical protein